MGVWAWEFGGNDVDLQYMRYTAYLFIFTFIFLLSCNRSKSPYLWDTGTTAVDSLLTVADSLDMCEDYDEDASRAVYGHVARVCAGSRDPRLRAAELYALAALQQLDDDTEHARRNDSIALALCAEGDAPYLTGRLKFDLARLNPDITARVDDLYGLLPLFREWADSVRVIETFIELNGAYGDIWDPETQTACFREILEYIPARHPHLREIMMFNLLAVERGRPAEVYLQKLDSMRAQRQLMASTPALGVFVYSDLYRLKGVDADLDTAELYIRNLVGYHDSRKIYASQRLRQAIHGRKHDSVAVYAEWLRAAVAQPTTMEVETLPALIDYYKYSGDSAAFREMSAAYEKLRTRTDVYEEANEMAKMRAGHDLKRALERHKSSSAPMVWILIAAILVVGGAAAWIITVIRRGHRQKAAALSDELETARRRLTVVTLQEASKTQEADDWERFEAVFVERRPGFPDNLKREYPALTRGDIRLCALLSMDLDTKHIARLLCINPESVKKHKQRLRAKFGLKPDVDWRTFLSRF